MTTVYDELEQAWKRELHSSDLQPLRQGLLKDLSSYIKRLREAERNVDSKSLKSAILADEILRLQQLLDQLFRRRVEKITSLSDAVQSNSLDNNERQLFQSISEIIREYDKITQEIVQGREPSPSKSKKGGQIIVRFVRDVPSIIGVDLKAHGPFRKEDVASLPSENAESLIRQGAVAEVNASHQDNE